MGRKMLEMDLPDMMGAVEEEVQDSEVETSHPLWRPQMGIAERRRKTL